MPHKNEENKPFKLTPLTKGFYAIVDADNYDYLMQWSWCAYPRKHTTYAYTGFNRGKNKTNHISMHRLIMNPPKGMVVDHVDHNGLNNMRSNLRIVTQSENMKNSTKKPKDESREPRIILRKVNNKIYKYYQASVSLNGKKVVKTSRDINVVREAYKEVVRNYNNNLK